MFDFIKNLHDNELIKILELYPDKLWNINDLSMNPNITIQYILQHLDYNWNWKQLTVNKNIQIDDIMSSYELPWSINSGIEYYTYNTKSISYNPNLTLKDVIKYDINWDWKYISGLNWVNLDIVKQHPELHWDINRVRHSNININEPDNDELYDIIANKINDNLTYNDSSLISLQYIIKYPNNHYDWNEISMREDITMQDIINNITLKWEWKMISRNPNLTIQFIADNPKLPWDWYSLSIYLPNITTIIDNYNYLPWAWDGISKNPNINLDFIKENLDKLYWTNISQNKFKKDPILIKKNNTRINYRKLCFDKIQNIIIKDITYLIVLYI